MITCAKSVGSNSWLVNKYRALSTDDFTKISGINGDEVYLMDEGKTIFYDEENDKWYYDDGSEFGGDSEPNTK